MSKKYNIIWEKWKDPLGLDEDYTNYYPINNNEDISDDINSIKTKNTKIIVTPMGILPYNDSTAISQMFDFWIGHCNFDISDSVCSVIEHTDGIESLDIYTRYRFRIGIGKAFDAGNVMRTVNQKIYEYFNNKHTNE